MAHVISKTTVQTIATVQVDDDGTVDLAITGCPAGNIDGRGATGVRASLTAVQARELANALDQCAREAVSYAIEQAEAATS